MPRARDPVYREHFKAAGKLKWRCNICQSNHAMTRKQAMFHEATKKHYSKAATTFFNYPEIFKFVLLKDGNGKWLCQICNGAAMSVKQAKAHETWCQGPNFEPQGGSYAGSDAPVNTLLSSQPQVGSHAGNNAANAVPSSQPQVSSYAGNNAVNTLLSSQWWTGSSTRNVASLPEGLEAAERDLEAESLHGWLDDRREENSDATSRHREGRAFERTNDDDEDEDENEDEDDKNNDNDNADDNDDSDNIDATFVENFVHCHILDTSRGERM